MKKIITAVLLTAMVSTCFASCAKEFTCDTCMKDVKSKVHKGEVLGVEVSMCDDCYDDYKQLQKEIKEMAN